MRFRLTHHVRQRMAERGITEEDIRCVLEGPITTWSDPENRSRNIRGTISDGRALKVCLVDPSPSDGIERVKTAMWV